MKSVAQIEAELDRLLSACASGVRAGARILRRLSHGVFLHDAGQSTFGEKGRTTEDYVRRFQSYELLVLDEIDQRPEKPWYDVELRDLINERYNRVLSTVLITNRSLRSLTGAEGMPDLPPALRDRINEDGGTEMKKGDDDVKTYFIWDIDADAIKIGISNRPWPPGDQSAAQRVAMLEIGENGWTEGKTVTHVGDDRESMFRLGKHIAGRVLDGRTWDEYPRLRSREKAEVRA